MPSKKLPSGNRPRTALIGCGRIAFLLESDPLRYKPCTHYGGARSAGLAVDYACDISPDRLERFRNYSGIPAENCFRNYRALFEAASPDIAIIATWTESHAEIGVEAARRGAKIIICEKPVAPDLAEARRLIETCKKHGTKLIINHERRYDRRYRTVKRLIDQGKIGRVRTVRASVLTGGYRGPSHIREGGGPLLHDGTHMVDIIRFFFGDISSVEGSIERAERKKGFEDRAVGWLRTESGIDVFLEAGGSRRYFEFELDISGSEGRIVIGNGYERLYLSKKSTLYVNFRDLKEQPLRVPAGMYCFKRMYAEVRSLWNGSEEAITSTGEDGYRALEAIHALYLSAFLRKSVDLPVKPATIDLRSIFKL